MLRDVLMYSGLLRPETATMLGVKHVQFKSKDGLQVEPLPSPVLPPGGGRTRNSTLRAWRRIRAGAREGR